MIVIIPHCVQLKPDMTLNRIQCHRTFRNARRSQPFLQTFQGSPGDIFIAPPEASSSGSSVANFVGPSCVSPPNPQAPMPTFRLLFAEEEFDRSLRSSPANTLLSALILLPPPLPQCLCGLLRTLPFRFALRSFASLLSVQKRERIPVGPVKKPRLCAFVRIRAVIQKKIRIQQIRVISAIRGIPQPPFQPSILELQNPFTEFTRFVVVST
jgi:hypothetical protein